MNRFLILLSALFVCWSAGYALAEEASGKAEEGAETKGPAQPVLTKAPELKKFVEAAYPAEAASGKLEGMRERLREALLGEDKDQWD